MSGDVSITEASPPPVAWIPGRTAVVLPDRVVAGRGEYSYDAVTAVEELFAAGVTAEFAHPLDQCDWSDARGPVGDIVFSLIVGVASSAAWDAVRAMIGRRSGHVRLKIGYRRDPVGAQERWLEIEGDPKGVASALDRVNPWQNVDNS